jgi:hypothetical protein
MTMQDDQKSLRNLTGRQLFLMRIQHITGCRWTCLCLVFLLGIFGRAPHPSVTSGMPGVWVIAHIYHSVHIFKFYGL